MVLKCVATGRLMISERYLTETDGYTQIFLKNVLEAEQKKRFYGETER